MTFTRIFLFTALPLSLMLACGGGTEGTDSEDSSGNGDGDGDANSPPTSSEGKEESCTTFCEEIASCEGLTTEGCTDSCTDSSGVSRGGQEVLADCVGADLCGAEASELDGVSALACLTEGLDDLELSDAGTEYCASSVDTINACLGEPTEESPLGGCEETIALASDEFLEGMNDCAGLSCDVMEACVSLQLIQNISLETLAGVEEGGDLPASVVSDLLAVAVVAGQLGVAEDTSSTLGGSITDLLGGGNDQSGGAGAPSR